MFLRQYACVARASRPNAQRAYAKRNYCAIEKKRILVTGSMGQIGTELVPALRELHEEVFATDIFSPGVMDGPFEYLDILDVTSLDRTIVNKRIDTIVHLSGILSAKAENNVKLGMDVNVRGLENVMATALKHKCALFAPSSIAAFGPSSPLENTPNECFMSPTTLYGIAKVYTENLGQYWHRKAGLDFRCIRYPGIISHKTQPGGGTTDWAVSIFHEALSNGHYECFLSKDCSLPMMYMNDCLMATLQLMMMPRESLSTCVYNVTAMSLAPEQLAAEIKKHVPNFTISYNPDFRETIAREWPRSLDDSKARNDWGWNPSFGVEELTADMINNLRNPTQQNDVEK